MQAVLDEPTAFVRIVRAHGAWPGGLHLEMTPESVTECVARSADVRTAALNLYRSPCDPHLNAELRSGPAAALRGAAPWAEVVEPDRREVGLRRTARRTAV